MPLNFFECISFITYLEQQWNSESSQNPNALEKIRALEAEKMANLPVDMDSEDEFAIPTFTKHINDVVCDEEDIARFECSLEPKTDPNMKLGNCFNIST